MSAARKPATDPVTPADPAIVALAAEIFELRLQLAEMLADQAVMRAEIERLAGRLPERRSPPAGWVPIKMAAGLAGVSIETARAWAINKVIVADMFAGRWFVDPASLGVILERQG